MITIDKLNHVELRPRAEAEAQAKRLTADDDDGWTYTVVAAGDRAYIEVRADGELVGAM